MPLGAAPIVIEPICLGFGGALLGLKDNGPRVKCAGQEPEELWRHL